MEWPSIAIGLAAGIALLRFKINVIYVIVAAGLTGLLVQLW
jgi:chromate transporter